MTIQDTPVLPPDVTQIYEPPMEEAVVLAPPVINVTRSLCVVYSTDSIFSTMSAGMIKRFVEERMPADLKEVYDISYMEIGDLCIEKSADAYLWLGMKPVKDAVYPTAIEDFKDAQHLTIEDLGYSDDTEDSEFQKSINDFRTVDDRGVIYLSSDMEPLPKSKMTGNYVFGFLTRALNNLSTLIPELKFEDMHQPLLRISHMENSLVTFYHPSATVECIMGVWTAMNEALRQLGHPYNEGAFDLLADDRLSAYDFQYKETRAIVNAQSQPKDRVYIPEYKSDVVVTRMPKDFWMARRIIQMGNKYYHNTRLTVFGLHAESNGGSIIRAKVADGRTVNSH